MRTTDPKRGITTRWRRSAVAAGTIAALAVITACGTTGPDASSASQPSKSETSVATSRPSTPAASPKSTPSVSASTDSDDPTEGWQTVRYGKLDYKVPPDWDIEQRQSGKYKIPRPTYGKGQCKTDPDLSLGMVVFTENPDVTSPKKAVRAELKNSADKFYPDRKHKLDIGQQKHKGRDAAGAAGIDLAPSDDPCDGSSAVLVIRGWTAPHHKGVYMLIAIGEIGNKNSPDAGDIARIANSVGSSG